MSDQLAPALLRDRRGVDGRAVGPGGQRLLQGVLLSDLHDGTSHPVHVAGGGRPVVCEHPGEQGAVKVRTVFEDGAQTWVGTPGDLGEALVRGPVAVPDERQVHRPLRPRQSVGLDVTERRIIE